MHNFDLFCKIICIQAGDIEVLTFLHLTNLHNSITLNVT